MCPVGLFAKVKWLILAATFLTTTPGHATNETLTKLQENTPGFHWAGVANYNERRSDPIESRADFFGYRLRDDGTFSALFCPQGKTVTTIGTLIDCCPVGGSSCEFGLTCSRSYAVRTVLQSPAIDKTTKQACNGGYRCITSSLFQSEITTIQAITTPPLVRAGCAWHIPGNPYPSYFLTLTPGAEVTIETPSYPPGQVASTTSIYIPPVTSSEPLSIPAPFTSSPSTERTTTTGDDIPSLINTGGTPLPTLSSPNPDNDNDKPRTTSRLGGEQGSSGSNTSDSESSASLSRSDQIAIGIGIGLGFPTVLIGVLAWFYPRHRLPARWTSAKYRAPRGASTPVPPWEQIGEEGGGGGGGAGGGGNGLGSASGHALNTLAPSPVRGPEIISTPGQNTLPTMGNLDSPGRYG